MSPSWKILDRALSYLEAPCFDDAWYALVFRGTLEAELRRIFEWLENSDGAMELHPSPQARWLAQIVMELEGSHMSGPCGLIHEAMIVLEAERVDGRLPSRLLNNYMSLKYALEFGDCQDWSVISLAKQIVFMDYRDSEG